jgi:hypothetical protein
LSTPPSAANPVVHASTRPQGAPIPGSTPVLSRRRGWHERASTRLLATVGIIGLATILGAALVSQNVDGWIVGMTVGLLSAVVAGRLWSSRQT